MVLYPAIDLRGGKCVRLLQGQADAQTVYSEDPGAVARGFRDAGAEWIHVVDLDGAFGGEPRNRGAVEAIVAAGLKVELGGGMRDRERIDSALALGVTRVVLGTKAAQDPEWLRDMIADFGERIAVGIDARDGWVAVKGWVEKTSLRAVDFALEASSMGAGMLIYTDVATDGMLQGPNFRALDEVLQEARCDVIASGGVSSADDLRSLAELSRRRPNLHGAIVGKAIYEGRVTVQAALEACRG
jgi:phosphoribosylformimino-5-aminoimidazole carboxamide ribotide isomerase